MDQLTPQQHRELIKSQVAQSYNNLEDCLEKGGARMPIGTTHNGYKKVADGKWQKVSEHKNTLTSNNDAIYLTKKDNEKQLEHHTNKLSAVYSSNRSYMEQMHDEHYHKDQISYYTENVKNLDDKDYSDDKVLGKESEGSGDKISKDQLTHLKVGQTFTIGEDMKLSSSRASGSYYNLSSSKYGDIKLTVEKINDKTIQCTVGSEDYDKLPQSAFNYNRALQVDRIMIKL